MDHSNLVVKGGFMSKLRRERRKALQKVTIDIDLDINCELVESEYLLQLCHYSPTEKLVLAGKLIDNTPTSTPELIPRGDLKVLQELEDRYFRLRKSQVFACKVPDDCQFCDLSESRWFSKLFKPSRFCNRESQPIFESYEDFLSSLL
jgi:hypothetical protein